MLQQSLPRTRLAASVLPSTRHSSTSSEALASPVRVGEDREYPEKIKHIVDQVSSLTLLEVADLNELLKVRQGNDAGILKTNN